MFLGYKSYIELDGIRSDIENFEYNPSTDLTEKVDLPIKIGDKITIEWTSSNENVISNNGDITFPGFEDGDVEVTLVGKIIISFEEVLSPYLLDILGIEIPKIEEKVIVPCKAASEEDKVKNVSDRLTLIDQTYSSISLPTKLCYDSINIYWESSNKNVMDNNGKVTTPSTDTLVTLEAKIESNGYIEVKQFDILVLTNPEVLEVVEDNFDNQAQTSQYSTITSTSGVKYYNGRIS